MTTSSNKQVAREFFERFTASDIDGALATMTDDATWWIAGKPGQIPRCGVRSKTQMARLFAYMVGEMEHRLAMTVTGLIAEDDKVAAEVVSHGRLRNGRVYENEYHILMTLRDGRICAVREYLDTYHVHSTWFEGVGTA